MNLNNKNVLLSGAAGGIGSEIALRLAEAGANIALLDRDARALEQLNDHLQGANTRVAAYAVDLLDRQARDRVLAQVKSEFGQVDVLINTAGLMSYRRFDEEDPVTLERLLSLNTLVPMELTRQLLPGMLARDSGLIVNIGSTFGSIGFACFSAYSASKYALRGFSEALRRELADTGVGVCYVAPRAVKTSLNTDAVYQMADATGMNMDSPEWVAGQVIKSIQADRREAYLGFPESLFVRINSLFPRLVDMALRKQNRKMSTFAGGKHA